VVCYIEDDYLFTQDAFGHLVEAWWSAGAG
jgi:hypothetical protein